MQFQFLAESETETSLIENTKPLSHVHAANTSYESFDIWAKRLSPPNQPPSPFDIKNPYNKLA